MAAWRVLPVGIGWLLSAVLSSAAASPDGKAMSNPAFIPPSGWSLVTLSGAGDGVGLTALRRPALTYPARYSVVVVPGSGCTGWLPVAARYFAGLLHAELLVLHKPHVNIAAGLAAVCTAEFVKNDTLSAWRDQARVALRANFASANSANLSDPKLPVLLVGISEGAELLPDLAPEVPQLAGVVMISAPGLDPLETGELQAQRLGQESAWQALQHIQSSDASDNTIYQGRTLGYWRDFWSWKLAQPLHDAPWPLLRVWGARDDLVPELAYQHFTRQSQSRSAPTCQIRLPGADHALQTGQHDGLQWLWARIEVWARSPGKVLCDTVPP